MVNEKIKVLAHLDNFIIILFQSFCLIYFVIQKYLKKV